MKKSKFKQSKMETYYSNDVELLINGKPLINLSRVVINSGTKYFLIGPNGCGKTTLINRLYDELKDTIDILKIDQDIEIDTSGEQTVLDHILMADYRLYSTYKRSKELEFKYNMSELELNEYLTLEEYLRQFQWDKYFAEAKSIISGLGFSNSLIKSNILSGGWRMRLALGRAFLKKPRILILDEPTNHLDYNATKWLMDYLHEYNKTLIIVTHYQKLINELADICLFIDNHEMKGPRIYSCRGNYFNVKQMLTDSFSEMTKKYDKYEKALTQKRKTSTRDEVEYFIEKNFVPRPPREYKVTIEFDNVVAFRSSEIIRMRDVSFSYPGSRPVFTNLNFSVFMDSRCVIIGNNGEGKTTLFKLLNKEIEPTDGIIIDDDRVRVSYYNQQIMDNLPLELTPIQYLETLKIGITTGECRAILGKLGLKRNDISDPASTQIKHLSGGQKARVSLSSIQIKNPHVILFDEPTNHLDIETTESLIEAINNFNGGVVIITHDIHFIESLCDVTIYNLKDGMLSRMLTL